MSTHQATHEPTSTSPPKKAPAPRAKSASLPLVLTRSTTAVEDIPELSDQQLERAARKVDDLSREAEEAMQEAIRARQALIDGAIRLAVSSREWGHVAKAARRVGVSRTTMSRWIEQVHPGFLATVDPDKGRKYGYVGSRAENYAGTTEDAGEGEEQ